jgi:hypothetical protein
VELVAGPFTCGPSPSPARWLPYVVGAPGFPALDRGLAGAGVADEVHGQVEPAPPPPRSRSRSPLPQLASAGDGERELGQRRSGLPGELAGQGAGAVAGGAEPVSPG